jgi:hypothetical protein
MENRLTGINIQTTIPKTNKQRFSSHFTMAGTAQFALRQVADFHHAVTARSYHNRDDVGPASPRLSDVLAEPKHRREIMIQEDFKNEPYIGFNEYLRTHEGLLRTILNLPHNPNITHKSEEFFSALDRFLQKLSLWERQIVKKNNKIVELNGKKVYSSITPDENKTLIYIDRIWHGLEKALAESLDSITAKDKKQPIIERIRKTIVEMRRLSVNIAMAGSATAIVDMKRSTNRFTPTDARITNVATIGQYKEYVIDSGK